MIRARNSPLHAFDLELIFVTIARPGDITELKFIFMLILKLLRYRSGQHLEMTVGRLTTGAQSRES